MDALFDLESTPLQIKTNTAADSDAEIGLVMWNEDKNQTYIYIRFNTSYQYQIEPCMSDYTDLPVQPPSDLIKIWTITKTASNLTLECNGVELVTVVFEDHGDECVKNWETIEEILWIFSFNMASVYLWSGNLPWKYSQGNKHLVH